MRVFRVFPVSGGHGGEQASSAPIADLVTATKTEGVVNFHAPSSRIPQGAQELEETGNKRSEA
jgi:hypothetical protein